MLRTVFSRAMLLGIALVLSANLHAGVPLIIPHQGRLLDASDTPISGTFTIIYSIHTAAVGGTQLWSEDHVGVVVDDGLFSVQLGTTVPLTADILAGSGGGAGGAIRYLQVQLAGQSPISPRTPLVSSPYSVASSRVSGDVQTAPGELKLSAASDTKRIGIRVADSLAEASSISIDEPGVHVAMKITPDSTVFDQGETSGSRVMVHAVHRGEDRIAQIITPTTCGVAINSKGTGADKGRSIGSQCDDSSAVNFLDIDDDNDGHPEARGIISVKSPSGSGSATASSRLTCDPNEDGVPNSEISQSVTPTTCGVAINSKGTGADKGRTIGSQCDDSSAVQYLDIDSDGDGHAEARGIISVKSSTGSGSLSNSVSNQMTCDLDDDGTPDSEISQTVTPTTCGVAINTKGTGAAKGRTIGSQCDDSSAVHYLDLDDDGDGVAETSLREAATPTVAEISITKDLDVSTTSLRMAVTGDTSIIKLGYDGSASSSLTFQAGTFGGANPISHSSGAHLTPGGVWTNASDVNLKENFRPVDGSELLEKVEELPVSQWNYRSEPETVTHIGPTAQDFRKVFGVGENDKSISTIDPSGIALAAIKELSRQNRELKEQNAKLMKRLDDLAKKVEKLQSEK